MIDITDQRIRYLGYDVPLDLSGLPPTHADRLVQELQEAADLADGASDEEIEGAEDRERKRVVDLIRDRMKSKPVSDDLKNAIDAVATECAQLVLNNITMIKSETDAAGLKRTLTRWFDNAATPHIEGALADAGIERIEDLEEFLDELESQ